MKPVLVIGGGIAGIQASLDLADRGTKVHLVERTPSIGGVMAQLDKTFPTMDCSICILAPKMIECYRHPNITIHTESEVIGLEGAVGDFNVKVLEHPRSVDATKCTGCGLCSEFLVHLRLQFGGVFEPVFSLSEGEMATIAKRE